MHSLHILLLVQLVFVFVLCSGQHLVPIPLSFSVNGVDPYAQQGLCKFSFRVYIPISDGDSSLSSCTFSATIAGVSCLGLYDLQANSTYLSVSVDATFLVKAQPYNELTLQLTKPGLTSVYPLAFANETKFSFICENAPSIAKPDLVISTPKLTKSSYQFNTFQFVSYIVLNNTFTRPIKDLGCDTPGMSCDFTYVSINSFMVAVSFSLSNTGVYPDNVKIIFSPSNSIQIPSPIKELDYLTLTTTIEKSKSFKNSPAYGHYFQVLVNTSYTQISPFPPVGLPLVPLEGEASKMTFYLKWNGDYQAKAVIGNTLQDFYEPLTSGPSSQLVIGPDFGEGYTNVLFKTNSRFSGSNTNYGQIKYFSYPFGLIGYDGYQRSYKIPIVNDQSVDFFSYSVFVPDEFSAANIVYPSLHANEPDLLLNINDLNDPILESWDVVLFNDTHSILRIGASDDFSGVYLIVVRTNYHVFYLDKNNLVSGTTTNGTFEIFVPFKKSICVLSVVLQDNFGRATPEDLYGNLMLNFHYGVTAQDLNIISKINSMFFYPSTVDVSTTSQDVVLYLNLTQTLQERLEQNTVFLEVLLNPNLDNPLIQGVYDKIDQFYKFSFKVPAKIMPGNLDYFIIINGQQPIPQYYFPGAQLFAQNSQIIDMLAPIVISVKQYVPLTWELEFNDTSGIKNIIVGISSEYDVKGRNFSLPVNGQVSFMYNITYPLDPSCRDMKYWISYIYTEDMLGNKGETVRLSNSNMHPFYLFDDDNVDVISLTSCGQPSDTAPPTLDLLKIITTTNVTIPNTQVRVEYLVNDNTAVSSTMLPVCYFSGLGNEILSSESTVVQIFSNGSVRFTCDFIFPLKFGPKAFLTIYGIYDVYFNFIGFGIDDLASKGFQNSYILTTSDVLVIESTNSLAISSSVLYLYGNGFSAHGDGCVVYMKQDNESVVLTPHIYSGFALVLYHIKPAQLYTVFVNCPAQTLSSNVVTIKGPLYVEPTPSSNPSPTPSSTPPATTPPPPKCKSDCSEPQGYGKCVNGGCVCNPPHSGIDCSSVIDTTPVIKPNPNKPTVNVTIPGTSSGQTPEFTSFIYVVALREIDPLHNDQVINNYSFDSDKWILVEGGSYSNEQVTTVQYKYVIDNSLNTTIISTVQVFETATNITFGNQQLYMNPSTIKFTFKITSYPFNSQNNLLQLVMTAALESTEKVGCSYKEFVDDQSNSQYLKLQIEDRSLFGRFIKFGIIDGRQEAVSNTQLDNIYGGKELSKSTSDQSYIGLNVRYFRNYALIDPDFSVLIDQNTARDQVNSICTNKSKKLTNAQLAGIIVGGVVFFFIIGAVVIYFYAKKNDSLLAVKLRKIGAR
ncbi:hypothetical protein CYY_006253 [Polysphondylium violaceum]|uniref:EGF-like domain-containing protein n=1 Tax=Polysphondylium violaceum TaxID=133409 RepID=A0A8J4PSK1_9MYCE|nr:hypothetical protein CYY_006253 [Polysphondylium violaceum]